MRKIFLILLLLGVAFVFSLSMFRQHFEFSFTRQDKEERIFQSIKHKVSTANYSWAEGQASPEPTVLVGSYIVIDKNGKVVYARNADKKHKPASLTKLMTAMVALDLANLNDVFEVQETEVNMEPTILMVEKGERFTLKELLEASLLTSANDAAELIAQGIGERLGGSRQLFVKLMNQKAKNLGLINTHFQNPTGYDEENQFSTSRDLSKLAYYALVNYPVIAELVATPALTLQENERHKYYELPNWNTLLGVYPGVDGVKIGYTEKAGYVTIVRSRRKGEEFMVVLLGAPDRRARDLWSVRLLNAAFAQKGIEPFLVTKSLLKTKEAEWAKQLKRAKMRTQPWLLGEH